jgi:hypothetical protein
MSALIAANEYHRRENVSSRWQTSLRCQIMRRYHNEYVLNRMNRAYWNKWHVHAPNQAAFNANTEMKITHRNALSMTFTRNDLTCAAYQEARVAKSLQQIARRRLSRLLLAQDATRSHPRAPELLSSPVTPLHRREYYTYRPSTTE